MNRKVREDINTRAWTFEYRGRPFVAIVVSKEEMATLSDTNDEAIGMFISPDGGFGNLFKLKGARCGGILIREDAITLDTIMHELWHMSMWSNMLGACKDMISVDAWEEISAENFAFFSKNIMSIANDMYKEMKEYNKRASKKPRRKRK